MGIAIACCVVAYVNWEFAANWDSSQLNADKIYRVQMGMGGRYALERDGGFYWLEGNPFGDYHTGMLIEDTPMKFAAPVRPSKVIAISCPRSSV